MSWYGSVARRTSATISSAERGWSAQAGMALNTRPASAMRRPRRMAAAYTRRVSGVATAQLYPSVTISPSWVLQAVGGPVAAPSILGSIAGDIVSPIFHGGALKAQQRAAVDAYESELGVYRQTLLVAFGQVADILRALQHDAELLGSETAAVTASKASLELAQAAYAAGRGSLVQVLDAQRLYAQALVGYARAKGQRYLDTVLLFEAMGGDSQAWVEARDP